MKKIGIAGLIFILAVGSIVILSSAFTVHQTQQALILRFGEAKRIITEPGFRITRSDSI